MGLRGPIPTPAEILRQRGTFRPDRHRDSAKPSGKPACPKWLSKDAKKEWRRIVKVLSSMNLIGAADTNALARYATTWVRWRQAIQLLTQSGEVVVYRDEQGKPKAVQPSAFHAIARSLAEELSRLEMQLGMNPAARSRIEVAPAAQPASDNKSRFFDTPMRIAN